MNTHKAGPYGGPIAQNYPRDQWWVAATADEVTRTPLQRWILDYPVVLYRKEDGGIVALDDRCPHRWAPLSKGWLEGDNIVCGYHGFRYGPTGRCVRVPTQSAVPAKAFVKSYPILERGPLVWIWTGDPQHAESALPTDIPWLHDEKWRGTHGYMDIAANYMLLKENVLDLTHFGYVHRTTFKILDWDRSPDVKVENNRSSSISLFRPGLWHRYLRKSPASAPSRLRGSIGVAISHRHFSMPARTSPIPSPRRAPATRSPSAYFTRRRRLILRACTISGSSHLTCP